MSNNGVVKPVRIQALKRSNDILGVLLAGPFEGLPLRDIARAVNLAPTTAFTLLESLADLRLVEKVRGERRYRLGFRLLQLGRKVEARLDIIMLACPSLIRLCQQTGEMVNLLVPSVTSMIVAESLKGNVVLKTTPLKGRDLPMHGTASGKCFLAFSTIDVRAAIFETLNLTRMTARTISDLKRLEKELREIRRQGYATEEDEFTPDTVAIAVPLLDSLGRIQATLSIHGSSARISAARRPALLEALQREARRIEALLL